VRRFDAKCSIYGIDQDYFEISKYKDVKPRWFKLEKEVARTSVEEAMAEIKLDDFDEYLDSPIEQVLIEKIRFTCLMQ
jgi:hypothetical protein